MDSCCFWICDDFNSMRSSLYVTWVWFGDLSLKSSETLSSDSVFAISWPEPEIRTVIFFLSFSIGSDSLNSHSFFFFFVIVLEFVANGDEFALELRRKTIRWWIFVKNLWGLMNFLADSCLILILENSRVCSWFLMIFCFWSVTE